MPSLDLRGLTKNWPAMTVSVDLQAESGTILAIVGPSGCGKSTVLRMIAGLERPDSGQILVGEKDVTAAEPSKRGIGMVFQDYALFPHLDVAGNIAFGLRDTGMIKKIHTEKLLQSVRLAGFGKRKPHELSGGEKQRVALARTLAVEPGVILFDEPLSSLDAALRRQLRSEIVEEQRRLGFTAVYVTHDLEEALAISDVLAIMTDGRVLQCAPPRDLWEHPASAAVARFMGSGPCLPVVEFQQSIDSLIAYTETGRFSFSRSKVESAASCDPGTTQAETCRYVYFGRAAAIRTNGPGAEADCYLEARCLHADFAGDTVDCAMQAGKEFFLLRFGIHDAPHPGETCKYRVSDAMFLS